MQSIQEFTQKTAQLKWNGDIRLEVRMELSAGMAKPFPGDSKVETKFKYAATGRGQRYFDERVTFEGGGNHRAAYSDGKKNANVTFLQDNSEKQEYIQIGLDFMGETEIGFVQAPEPLRFYHVGLVPLPKALPKAQTMGNERVIGRDCGVFHFKSVGPARGKQSLVYHLDSATGIPLRVSAFDNPDAMQAKTPNWVWEAQELSDADGHLFPIKSSRTSYLKLPTKSGGIEFELDRTCAIVVDKIEFEPKLSSTSFWPTLQPGVEVSDLIQNRRYTVPDKAETQALQPQQTNQSIQTQPIRVGAPSGEGISSYTVGLVLSLVIFCIAGALWRKS
jgi:hypothetical protein